MSIYRDCNICAFKRKNGCTRTGATTRLMARTEGLDRKKTKCNKFKLSYKRNKSK